MKEAFKSFITNVLVNMKKPEMRILPGQLAFFLLLSIIPLIALIAVIASNFSLSIETLIDSIENNLPKEISDFMIQIVDDKSININIIVFSISGFILASNGPHSMIIGSNLLYKIPDKGLLSRRIKAVILTIILVNLFLFLLIVPAFGDILISFLISIIPKQIGGMVTNIYSVIKYPISIFFIFFFIKVLYTIAPDKKVPSKTTTKGAIFTTIGWILATEIYSFYVSYFARYNLLYGSVANLLILFLWIYLLSYIFVLGMALNASSYQENKKIGIEES